MKLTLLIIAVCFITINSNAQTTLSYDTCQRLGQFQGEWRYVNNSDTIRVYLKLHRGYYENFRFIADGLLGWLEYKKGNIVIISTYANKAMILPYNNPRGSDAEISQTPLRISFMKCSDPANIITGSFLDPAQGGRLKDIRGSINAAGTQMSWRLHHIGIFQGEAIMTLPEQFILIKQ